MSSSWRLKLYREVVDWIKKTCPLYRFFCIVSFKLVLLGHLKKIISFSSSWLRNLNAAGGNLILSIYCASYIQTT